MKKILIFFLLIASLTGYGTVWYVDESGNDGTGDGSSGNPWALVSYACTQASSGDTIYVNAGTIAESVQIVKPLGVHIYGAGATSIIVSTYAGGYTGSINCASSVGNPVNDGGSISYIALSGSSYTARIGIYVAYRNNVDIHHCTISGFNYGAIRYITNNADVFTAPTVNYGTGHSIHDNSINDCGYLNSSYASVWFDGTSGMAIYNNTFVDTARAPGSNSWATIKCTFNTGYDIYDNTFYREDHENGRFNFFIESWNYEGDCQFRDNTLYGLAGADFGGPLNQIKAGFTYGLKVTGNYFINENNGNYTNGGNDRVIYGICVEGSGHDSVIISRNLLQRFGWGVEIATAETIGGTYADDWTLDNITISHNIIQEAGYLDHQYCYGINVINETNTGSYTTTMTDFAFLNNTITAMTGSTYQGIRLSCNGTLTGLDISNNIIYGFDSYGIYLGEHSTDGFELTNADVTYNCMNGNGTNTVGVDGDIVQTNVDVSTGNITTAPTFVSSSDLHLQSTSTCINAGTDVSSLTGGTDFHGASLYGAAYDIGAFEYGANRVLKIDDTTLPTINYKIILIDH